MVTLAVYLAGGLLTACTAGKGFGWVLWLDASRFIAGMGIGGEYAAINSAIDELIHAKYRGRVDIAVNGSYWAGATIATLLTVGVVNNLSASISWRIAFLLGPALAFVILFVRKNLPESPRWLLMHGRVDEADAAVKEIEDEAAKSEELGPVSQTIWRCVIFFFASSGASAALIGVDAEGKSLEDIATPLSLQRSGSAPLKSRGSQAPPA
jgi:MFS family permease